MKTYEKKIDVRISRAYGILSGLGIASSCCECRENCFLFRQGIDWGEYSGDLRDEPGRDWGDPSYYNHIKEC